MLQSMSVSVMVGHSWNDLLDFAAIFCHIFFQHLIISVVGGSIVTITEIESTPWTILWRTGH